MADNEKEMRFKAHGITCRECASDMEGILKSRDGITGASVDYDESSVDVTFDAGVLTPKDVYAAVRGLGFKVDVLKK